MIICLKYAISKVAVFQYYTTQNRSMRYKTMAWNVDILLTHRVHNYNNIKSFIFKSLAFKRVRHFFLVVFIYEISLHLILHCKLWKLSLGTQVTSEIQGYKYRTMKFRLRIQLQISNNQLEWVQIYCGTALFSICWQACITVDNMNN